MVVLASSYPHQRGRFWFDLLLCFAAVAVSRDFSRTVQKSLMNFREILEGACLSTKQIFGEMV